MMENQNPMPSTVGQWREEITKTGTFKIKKKFIAISQDFQFRIILRHNIAISLLQAEGHLVFNNGLTVPIISAHQSLFNRFLNPVDSRVNFCINQTLVFTAKILGGLDSQKIENWMGRVEGEVISKRKIIETLLAVIGYQMDSQHQLMKQLHQAKKDLKMRIETILDNPASIPKLNNSGDMEQEGSSVIVFGEGKDCVITPKNTGSHKNHEGGYFEIEEQQYIISNREGTNSERRLLCKKKLKEKRMQQQHSQNQLKMKKELSIVDSIKDQRFLLKYYYEGDINHLSYILMEKIDHNLQEYVYYYGDALEIKSKIQISKKIVEAIMVLHQYGVVHRDIKPSNILIQDIIDNPVIKIIDFAESYSDRVPLEVETYASSFPYSPLECSERESINPNGTKKGIVNPQIDYWSVGMTIYQVFFRKLPVSFSKTFLSDIVSSWKTELLLAVNQRQKFGLAVIDQVITILCVKMIKFEQKERMNLKMAYALLVELDRYVADLMKIVEKIK